MAELKARLQADLTAAMKNREKVTSKIRHRDASDEAGKPGVPHAAPVASNSGPVDPAAIPNPLASPDHPAA